MQDTAQLLPPLLNADSWEADLEKGLGRGRRLALVVATVDVVVVSSGRNVRQRSEDRSVADLPDLNNC
nr:hypothetical protein BaRGS_028005 [Batillaria attramentaria]